MAGHTEGPWIAAAQISSVAGLPVVASPEGRLICNVNCIAYRQPVDRKVDGDAAFNKESKANARLIAAAPDLLAACKRLVAAIGIPSSITIGDAVEQAEAAIARAEGEKR
ncbi:hypothetical protein ACFOGJ_16290 [Marinibaculum pumilum]|uniref:Uncharacterized protein n=1 Tax=Marinibaculum pumilum TaxID=1766165 RepID=A0ABV7L2D2_9PROT